MEFLEVLNPWHWWMLATLLLAAEFLSPCAYFMAIAVSSALVGLIWKVIPGLAAAWQLGLFAVMSLLTLGLAYYYRSSRTVRHSDRSS